MLNWNEHLPERKEGRDDSWRDIGIIACRGEQSPKAVFFRQGLASQNLARGLLTKRGAAPERLWRIAGLATNNQPGCPGNTTGLSKSATKLLAKSHSYTTANIRPFFVISGSIRLGNVRRHCHGFWNALTNSAGPMGDCGST